MAFPGVHPLAVELPAAADGSALAAWLTANPQSRPRTRSGMAVSFVEPVADGEGYEARIWRTGEVATRTADRHDFINAQAWLNFPQTKAVINARHVEALQRQPDSSRRDPERDALTHFDECGAIVVSRNPELLELLRGFRWKTLFWQRRDEVCRDMALLVFGHATLAAMAAPFRGLTVKSILEPVSAGWFGLSVTERVADLDKRMAARFLAHHFTRPRDFQPLPVLGWPGVTAASDGETYYDDDFQFRAGRRTAATRSAV